VLEFRLRVGCSLGLRAVGLRLRLGCIRECLSLRSSPAGAYLSLRRAVNLIQSRNAFCLRSWEILTWVLIPKSKIWTTLQRYQSHCAWSLPCMILLEQGTKWWFIALRLKEMSAFCVGSLRFAPAPSPIGCAWG